MEAFVCHDCDNIYLSKEDFSAHSSECVVDKSKAITRLTEIEINPPPDGVRKCPFCFLDPLYWKNGKSLKSRLEKHVKKRHPDKCGTEIPWQVKYRQKCQFCFLDFSTLSSLTVHLKRKHDNTIKKTACEVCGKLIHPTNMRHHVAKNHEERDVECTICHHTLSNQYSLKRHVRFYHENKRNKQCQECGKRFVDNTKLRKHEMVVHQKLKPFKCDSCDFLCGTMSNLNHHRKIIHSSTDTLTKKNFNNLSLKEIQEKFTQSDEL